MWIHLVLPLWRGEKEQLLGDICKLSLSTVIMVKRASKKNYPSKVDILSTINYQANSYTFIRFSDTYDE
jgi:diphthamide synthase (EF-2-diphthine--ammonia ligase)